MLRCDDLHTYYGDSYVLQGLNLSVDNGTVVALLGRNGVGKTTTIRSIIGFTPPRRGRVLYKGMDITGLPSYRIARLGIGLVPQGRRIFPSLTTEENLTMAARDVSRHDKWTIGRVHEIFPILKERAKVGAGLLSGGEQQMLSIGRALMTNPDLLLMDEPSEGLSPMIVREVGRSARNLANQGLTILLVEQNTPMALGIANYVYVVGRGKIVYGSTPDELRKNENVMTEHLGVG
jgi:branched-chain amino acid transport system ATP-binding protein